MATVTIVGGEGDCGKAGVEMWGESISTVSEAREVFEEKVVEDEDRRSNNKARIIRARWLGRNGEVLEI